MIDLTKYQKQTTVRKYLLHGELLNIHGEHAQRTLYESDKKYIVHTFPIDGDHLLIPLGGERGYIMGALRQALLDLYKPKLIDKTWINYGLKTKLEHGIFIQPDWTPVSAKGLTKLKKYLVPMKGKSEYMTPIYYDILERAPFTLEITITNDSIPEEVFLALLTHLERIGIGPKRRAKLKIEKLEKATPP